jgi:hypothetical protein
MRILAILAATLLLGLVPSPSAYGAAGVSLRASFDSGFHAGERDAGDAGNEPKHGEFAAEVLILHATNSGKGIDPHIGKMPELKKPPFSAYDSYEQLSKSRVSLKKDDPKTIKLPNGRVLQTKLLDVLPNEYLRISASINQPGGKDFLPLLEVKAKVGQAFIVAGQSYKNGILVLVIRVVK